MRHVSIYGVPRGSVLGPLLFVLYTADLGRIADAHDVSAGFYADDSQLYVSAKPQHTDDVSDRLRRCMEAKCVHGAAPSYLAEMCIPVVASTGRRFLRSASHGDLMVPRARTSTYMDNVVLLFPDLPSGMISHRLYVHRRRHLDSSRIN